MDNVTLKKKLSTYVSEGGYLKNISEDVLYEVLVAWENWSGPTKDFYKSIGYSHRQMASLIGKAKKHKREGYFGEGDFKQAVIESTSVPTPPSASATPCQGVELIWDNNRVIRFAEVDQLLDFLKKVA